MTPNSFVRSIEMVHSIAITTSATKEIVMARLALTNPRSPQRKLPVSLSRVIAICEVADPVLGSEIGLCLDLTLRLTFKP